MAKYSDLLRNPLWQRKRLEILHRDNFTCQHCKDTETELHVHHLHYSGKPWEIESDKLITICRHCHYSIEKFDCQFIGICKVKTKHGFTVIRNTIDKQYMFVFFNINGEHVGEELFSYELVNGIVDFHHNQLSNG